MAEKLIKIAKELNVATITIVEFLASKGIHIDSKPNTVISDEIHDVLLKQFSNSMALKEKADQIVIGSRPMKEEPKEEKIVKPLFSIPKFNEISKTALDNKVEADETPKQTSTPEEAMVPTEGKTAVEEKQEEVFSIKPETPKLKVLGKIDLDKPKVPKPSPQDEEIKQVEAKQEKPPKEDKIEEKPSLPELETKDEIPVEDKGDIPNNQSEDGPVAEEMMRATTPQLKGLKILGKIDTSKLDSSTKPKSSGKATSDNTKNETSPQKESESASKRKRKRKKLPNSNLKNDKSQDKAQKQEEVVKEVSQKEIDEKIKATMAKLTAGGKNKRQKIRRDSRDVKREKQELREVESHDGKLKVTEFISVSELASLLNVSVTQVITTCMSLGIIVSINQRLDAEIIELVSNEFGFEIEFISAESNDTDVIEDLEEENNDTPRAPIVTVMGHVDHGKTSLLDYIRSAKVVEGEAGGITQHIGAYEVYIGDDNKKITFLDTPGHEAFTAMRARGAKVTDVAVIIIAADDQIMPQTKEAISHAQAAGVPMVFAINKIDKPGADPEKIKQELASMNLLVEDWGGTYQSQDISAKSGLNVDKLLEKIVLEAEVLDLKCNPNKNGIGTVIEASLDKGKGYVTKVLVQNGSIAIGDPLVAGPYSGKIKAMFNETGKKVKKAGPATPVLILGLSGAPQAGEKFKIMDSEQDARQLATKRAQIEREQSTRASKRISLDEIGRRLALGMFKELNLIVKGDVDGSIEALSDSLIKLSVETIQVNVIHKAVGQIVESDVLLASASDAIIIGFQVRPSANARTLAEKEGVEIKTYSIIYEAIEEVKAAMEGMLEPTKEEKIIAQVDVRETYKISKVGTIAGCMVTEGKITRNTHVRIIRDGIVIYPTKPGVHGEISSLKRFKDDIKEVRNGMECGITIKNYNDIKEGDVIEGYEIIEIKQVLA